MRKNNRKPYLDYEDPSNSTSRLLIWQALRKYPTKALFPMLQDKEPVVRTSVARELQMRGGGAVWRFAKDLCKSKKTHDRVIGIFIISQLGTPRLPYQQESLDLIDSLLSRERSSEVVKECLYAIGHLRKGKPLNNEKLAQRIKKMKLSDHSGLSAAKAFAMRN